MPTRYAATIARSSGSRALSVNRCRCVLLNGLCLVRCQLSYATNPINYATNQTTLLIDYTANRPTLPIGRRNVVCYVSPYALWFITRILEIVKCYPGSEMWQTRLVFSYNIGIKPLIFEERSRIIFLGAKFFGISSA